MWAVVSSILAEILFRANSNFQRKLFFKMLEKFSIGVVIMLKVSVETVFIVLCAGKRIMNVRYVLQNIFKKFDQPPSGGVNNFNATLTQFGAICRENV